MIGVDSNLLLRLIVQDDEPQARRAEALLGQVRAAGEAIYVSDVVLCEVEWVLGSVYQATRAEILATLRHLAGDPHLTFEDRSGLWRALELYGTSRADFSDSLLGTRAQAAGARTCYTFDRALRDLPGFTWLR